MPFMLDHHTDHSLTSSHAYDFDHAETKYAPELHGHAQTEDELCMLQFT